MTMIYKRTELPEGYIAVGTRTGKRVHVGYPGSSTTGCGHWLKYGTGSAYAVKADVNCQRCVEHLAAVGYVRGREEVT